MALAETLIGIFTSDAPTSAIAGDRVFPSAAPDGAARPYLVISQTEAQQLQVDGQMAAGWTPSQIEVAACADYYQAASNLADAAYAALADAAESGTGDIAAVEFTGRYDAPNLDDAQTLFAVVQTFMVTYRG